MSSPRAPHLEIPPFPCLAKVDMLHPPQYVRMSVSASTSRHCALYILGCWFVDPGMRLRFVGLV